MKQLPIYIILLFAFFGQANEAMAQRQGKIKKLEVTQFQKKLDRTLMPQLIDVRTPAEFDAGHLESAINYNLSDSTLHRNMDHLDRKKPVFIYCQSGKRSARAAEVMKQAGFRVFEMKDGFLKWQEEKLRVTGD